MGGLIRNSAILLSVSYVQHCIMMITGAVRIGGLIFDTRQRGIVGRNRYECDVVKHYCTTKTRVHGERAPQGR